jgi:CheY-like chemotaxis protein
MPIVDGMASTRMIRSYEHTELSPRAQLNGRVPIIAVSASLLEKERQTYIDTGFDGWILKPISFPRLSELMEGIVNTKKREEALYQPGLWEKGGWFHKAQSDVGSAPSKQISSAPGEGLTAKEPEQTMAVPASDTTDVGPAGQAPSEQSRGSAAQSQGDDSEGRGKSTASASTTTGAEEEGRRTASGAPALQRMASDDDDGQVFQTPLSTPHVEVGEPETKAPSAHPS